ncbi:hypothetical protein D3C71_2036870 [compost metagenome]
MRGPACQPSATVMRPPRAPNTRPVMSRDALLPSQATSGATFDGSSGSKSGVSLRIACHLGLAKMSSVSRLMAVG